MLYTHRREKTFLKIHISICDDKLKSEIDFLNLMDYTTSKY